MDTSDIEKFIQDGWVIVDIPQPAIIQEFRMLLERKVSELISTECRLENIHENVDDEAFSRVHSELANYFWEAEFSLRASTFILPLLKEIIGLDIMVQYMPFLRLARPGRSEDNIGFHKDTQYGQTPYELAVHLPFVDIDENTALRVISGSHRVPESTFARKEVPPTGFAKNSPQHMLGKPYVPLNLILPSSIKTEPLAMRVGQVALFTPALFHGQEINKGSAMRVSTDLRFVNANAKIDIKTGKTRAGYERVSWAPIEKSAAIYYQAQEVSSA